MEIKIRTSIWKKFLAPLIVSAVLSCGFLALPRLFPVLSSWMDIVADPTPDWYTKIYYNTINSITTTQDTFPDVIILNLKETITRNDLADLIQLVAECSPRAVGVDCTFSTSNSYDSTQTDALIKAIAQLDTIPPFVFASMVHETSVIPDSIIHYEGFVDAVEYNNYKVHKDGFPHLSWEMAQIAGYNVGRIDTSTFLVNYRTKTFDEILIYPDFKEYDTYIQDAINDKMVLIGRFDDRLDMHYVPFLIEPGVEIISGTKIIAYVLSSIISASNEEKCNNNIFHHYSRCPLWMNVILTIVFAFIYLCVYMLIAYAQQKNRWFELCKPLLLFCMLILIIVLSMVYTAMFYSVPYVGFFIVLTAFLGFAYDIFNPAISPTITESFNNHPKDQRRGKINQSKNNRRVHRHKSA